MVQDVSRAERMLKAYVYDDMTLEEIGKYHGVTRERVRQLLTRFDPTLYKLARLRRKARQRLEAFVNDKRALPELKHCRICNEAFMGTKASTFCSPVHYKLWVMLRYQIDEGFRNAQRRSLAKYALKNGTDIDKRHAQNFLDGTVGKTGSARAGTQYLVHGSLAFHWAIRAYVLNWPLFDMFRPDVQEQVKEYVAQK